MWLCLGLQDDVVDLVEGGSLENPAIPLQDLVSWKQQGCEKVRQPEVWNQQVEMMTELTWSEVSHRVGQASSLHLRDESTQSTSFSHLPSNHLEESGGVRGVRRRRKRSKRRRREQEEEEEEQAESGGGTAARGFRKTKS